MKVFKTIVSLLLLVCYYTLSQIANAYEPIAKQSASLMQMKDSYESYTFPIFIDKLWNDGSVLIGIVIIATVLLIWRKEIISFFKK